MKRLAIMESTRERFRTCYSLYAEDHVLREFVNVRQDPGAYRRLFTDDCFDLYLWYRRRWGRLRGFQLVYDKYKDPHALRWTLEGGYHHEVVRDGDSSGGNTRTPLTEPDGVLDHTGLADRFGQAAEVLPRRLRQFVHGRILEYGTSTPLSR